MMRVALFIALALIASPVGAQISNPTPAATVDTSNFATKAQVNTAQATADAANTAAGSAVKTVNGTAPTSGNVAIAIPSTAGLATTTALNAVAATVPSASTIVPPGVSDAGAQGTMTTIYALANHTHASKARKGRVLVPATGTLAVVFKDSSGNNAPFTAVPVCGTSAEATAGDTNVVNAQIDGTPTTTGMTLRITRTAQSVVALIGLTVLSVPTQIATYAHYSCIEP